MTFPEFVRARVIEDLYASMLLIDHKLPRNVHIIRLEHLHDDAERVLNRELGLNVAVRIPHLNRSSEGPFAELYTEEAKTKVRQTYKWYFQTDWSRTIDPNRQPAANDSALVGEKTDMGTGGPPAH